MTRRLILMRHGKSDWQTGQADFDRPLAPRGRRDAPLMGAWLATQDWRPDVIVSSPAARAAATAFLAAGALGHNVDDVHFVDDLYQGNATDYLAAAKATWREGHDTAMLVGHNPTLDDLATSHGATRDDDGKCMTSAACCLIGDGRVVAVQRPDQL